MKLRAIGLRNCENPSVKTWVQSMASLCKPDSIFWCNGSEEERAFLSACALHTNVLQQENPDRAPAFLEVAEASDEWETPDEMYGHLYGIAKGSMRGRAMFVVPYLMGPEDSPKTKVGIELTDSIEVVLNIGALTSMGDIAYRRLGQSKDFSGGFGECAQGPPGSNALLRL